MYYVAQLILLSFLIGSLVTEKVICNVKLQVNRKHVEYRTEILTVIKTKGCYSSEYKFLG